MRVCFLSSGGLADSKSEPDKDAEEMPEGSDSRGSQDSRCSFGLADCAQVLFMVLGVGVVAGGMNLLLSRLPRPEDDYGSKAAGHWLD